MLPYCPIPAILRVGNTDYNTIKLQTEMLKTLWCCSMFLLLIKLQLISFLDVVLQQSQQLVGEVELQVGTAHPVYIIDWYAHPS